jgi:hypothetical protein
MPYKKGQSGNPHGRIPGTKVKLQGAFLKDCLKAWELFGYKALEETAKWAPEKFVTVIASVLPKEMHVTSHERTAAEIAEQLARFADEAAGRIASPATGDSEAQLPNKLN